MLFPQKPDEHGDEEDCIRHDRHDGHQEEMRPRRVYHAALVGVWARIPECADLQCGRYNRAV